mmetsp:Transcript_12946/g.31492  ORF Transcript_12946/g.31492 Transcript_12946/m.31492 type:complete len:204 (-) Transcript_12946:599-1210(-)
MCNAPRGRHPERTRGRWSWQGAARRPRAARLRLLPGEPARRTRAAPSPRPSPRATRPCRPRPTPSSGRGRSKRHAPGQCRVPAPFRHPPCVSASAVPPAPAPPPAPWARGAARGPRRRAGAAAALSRLGAARTGGGGRCGRARHLSGSTGPFRVPGGAAETGAFATDTQPARRSRGRRACVRAAAPRQLQSRPAPLLLRRPRE